jgi:hypothetical protein
MRAMVCALVLLGCSETVRTSPVISVEVSNIPSSLTELRAEILARDLEREQIWSGADLAKISGGRAQLSVALVSAELAPLTVTMRALEGSCVIASGQGGCETIASCSLAVVMESVSGCPGLDGGAEADLGCDGDCNGR